MDWIKLGGTIKLMDTEAFEGLVEGATESASLDFKTACNWEVRAIIKDVLAMSNIQDGGRIVFGIEDGTLRRVGLSRDQLESFDEETIQDQVAEYADPYVTLTVSKVSGRDGLKFVVISVSEFEETPTICRKDGGDVKRGAIYYRSRSGRPASKPISNEHDMRDVTDRAVIKLMSKRRGQGYETPSTNYDSTYDQELGDL